LPQVFCNSEAFVAGDAQRAGYVSDRTRRNSALRTLLHNSLSACCAKPCGSGVGDGAAAAVVCVEGGSQRSALPLVMIIGEFWAMTTEGTYQTGGSWRRKVPPSPPLTHGCCTDQQATLSFLNFLNVQQHTFCLHLFRLTSLDSFSEHCCLI
jgi:hypothetical protein